MVIRAFSVVRSHPGVRDLLRARYPHLIIDEYQDLGGVLHQLVLALHDQAGIAISAVGDADQSVFGFTGADPRYIDDLAVRGDFTPVELEVNYRSGDAIIRAAEAALGRRGGCRRAAEGLAVGVVAIVPIDGGVDAHATEVISIVRRSLTAGIPPEKIAVLYPRRGPVLTAILAAFEHSTIPLLFEKDEQLPPGGLSQFVQRCASRAVVLAQVRRGSMSTPAISDALRRTEAPDLFTLERQLIQLRKDSGLPARPGRLTLLRSLQRALDPSAPTNPDSVALPWLVDIIEALELSAIAAQHPDKQSSSALASLIDACGSHQLTVQDLAATVEVLGKVVLTNYHTAKGREFDTVILPGLVNGIVPADILSNGRWEPPTGPELAEQRRTFFVAVSRAQAELNCLTGAGFHTPWGRWTERGPSDFLIEMERVRGS